MYIVSLIGKRDNVLAPSSAAAAAQAALSPAREETHPLYQD